MRLFFVRDIKKSGSPCKPSNAQIKYVDTGSVADNTIKAFEVYGGSEKPSRANLVVKPGDVLFAKMASSVKVVEIDDANHEYVYSTGFYAFRDTRIFSTYLKFFFLSPHFNRLKDKYSQGATMKAINDDGMSKISIEVPNLEAQEKRLKVLNSIWDARRTIREAIHSLDEQVKSLFNEMFGDPENNEKGFDLYTWSDLTDFITYGLTVRPKYVDDGIPLISAREIKTGVIAFDEAPKISMEDYAALSDKSKPRNKEIFMSKTGTIGTTALFDGSRPIAITQNIARICLKPHVNKEWFMAYLNNVSIHAKLVAMAKGNTVKDLQIQDMRKMLCYLPPVEQQQTFSEKTQQIDKLRFNYQQQLEVLQELMDKKMEEYFGGNEA